MPVVSLGSDTGNTWKWNGEVKKGRKLAKKGCPTKPILTVGNKLDSAGGTLRACKKYISQSFLPKGQGNRSIYTPGPIGHCLRTDPGDNHS